MFLPPRLEDPVFLGVPPGSLFLASLPFWRGRDGEDAEAFFNQGIVRGICHCHIPG